MSYRFQLTLALTLLIGSLIFLYFFTGVFGGATINVTIGTNPDLTNGLVGHWTFDGGDLISNAVDRSGQGNTGYLTNFTSTTTRPGQIGQALEFMGTTETYIDAGTGSTLSIQGPVTVCAWFNKTIFDGFDESIVANGNVSLQNNQYLLEVLSGGTVRFGWSDNSATFEFADEVGLVVKLGEWHHVCGLRNAADAPFVYVNGENRTSSQSGAVTPPATAGGITAIGRFGGQSSEYFDGLLDDVRVYNRALSTAEIKRLYELGR